MDSVERRDRILEAMLGHVPFDGWSEPSLKAGAVDAGLPAEDGLRAFPAGMLEVAEHFCDWGDRRMAAELAKRDFAALRVRERIAAAVRCRLEAVAGHREAVRRVLAFLALPQNGGAWAACTYRTVNAMWYAAGDTATDFNFYTKRGLLAAVYAATVLYWLTDGSEGTADTWAFLDRRVEGVMKFSRVQGRLSGALAGFGDRLAGLRRRYAPPSGP
jgi:ubiquinone biosynthesis protein COQ9